MNGARPEDRLTRIQQLGAAAAILLSITWTLNAVLRDPAIPFLTGTGDPAWIGIETPLDSNAIRVDASRVPAFTFSTQFELSSRPSAAELFARALTTAAIEVNGQPLPRRAPGTSWKQPERHDVETLLRLGLNEVRVEVENPRGPALLQLRLVDPTGASGLHLETDASWSATGPRGRHFQVREADDTRGHPQAHATAATGEALIARAGTLSLLFVLGALLYLAAQRAAPAAVRERPAEIVLGAATVFWIAVYTVKSSQLPVLMGFDIVGHLEYIDFLLERKAIPLATDGWSMYHPPLAYFLTSLLVAAFDLTRESAAARWLYRLPTFLAGLGNVWAAYYAARALFADNPLRVSLATGFAALLPMNLYMSAYVSNEPLVSFLVSLSLVLTTHLVLSNGVNVRRILTLAATLGLAILTKFTALVAVPLAATILGLKAWLADGIRARRAGVASLVLLVGVGLVGGWIYVRNWILLGRPVVGNWDLPGNLVWWEQPGFHTLAYYTSFGQSLRYPFFAGYHSLLDGVYSTFWGDGLVAGMIRLSTRHDGWNYDYMTIGYWLAFPATGLLVVGFGRALRDCLRGNDLRGRLALTFHIAFLCAVGFALFAITLRLPYYAQAKAFYTLSAIVPLSLVAALGFAWIPERLRGPGWLPARMAYAGWLGTLAASIVLSFLG